MKTDKKALTANQQVIEWGKQGIAQKENELKKRLEQDKAAAKPIARHADIVYCHHIVDIMMMKISMMN